MGQLDGKVAVITGGGAIVNVSSAHAVKGRSGMAQYDACKAAVLGLTRALAHDHAAQGIRVNAVCPGPTITQFHLKRAAARSVTEAEIRATSKPTLLKRQAEPSAFHPPLREQRLEHSFDRGGGNDQNAATGSQGRDAEKTAGGVEHRPALFSGGDANVQHDPPVNPAAGAAVPGGPD